MTNNPRRIVAGFALLLGVWVAVYWLYEPAEPPITFGSPPTRHSQTPAAAALDREPLATSPAASTIATDRPGQVLEKPIFREYLVQKGDTSFEAISKKVYGTPKHGPAISRANPFVTPDKLITARTRLNIPSDPTNVQGRVVTLPEREPPKPVIEPPQPASKPNAPTPAPAQPDNPKPSQPEKTYTVEAGDTLSEIASKLYGKSALWRHLANANKDRLPDASKLRAGLILRVPPPPSSGG